MTLMIIPEHGPGQRRKVFLILLCLIVMMLLCVSGCVRSDTGFTVRPEAFQSPPDLYADMNTTQVTMSVGDTMLVSYPWTPEDGRYWRVSVTEGLFVTGDRYVPFPADMPVEVRYAGMDGAGHLSRNTDFYWQFTATGNLMESGKRATEDYGNRVNDEQGTSAGLHEIWVTVKFY
jgi:hypothetical protein